MPAPALRDLRDLLTHRFPDAIPVPHRSIAAVATGIEALDTILPNGGFPKGRLSVWRPAGGATSVLRATCLTTVRAGDRVAWIDGCGTLAGPFWSLGPMLVRPKSRTHALRAAESLLRSGGLSLVVLMGIEPEGTENVRLSRAAHEGGCAATVVLTNSTTAAALKVSSHIQPHSYRWSRDPHGEPAAAVSATLEIRVSSLGWHRRTQVVVPVVPYDVSVALASTLPDRRGVLHRLAQVTA